MAEYHMIEILFHVEIESRSGDPARSPVTAPVLGRTTFSTCCYRYLLTGGVGGGGELSCEGQVSSQGLSTGQSVASTAVGRCKYICRMSRSVSVIGMCRGSLN